ncbi:hypothetical protein [Geodermatophilus siccatus]|uniref:hypothetical protein n=1 Tax=Geodermatophilus siccatus TaxID=1137991 RepID=UPI001113823F|nr:hypothetical protein [Geodermatophilus siccatus]
MSADPGFKVVVGADGGIAPEELARHGVRPGAHLRIVAENERPPIRPAYGALRGQLADVSWEDFEAASRLAVADVESGPEFPDR